MQEPKSRKPVWDILPAATKQKCLADLVAFFHDERDERIGLIAAEQILDQVMDDVVRSAYDKGVVDAKKLIESKIEDLGVELDLLTL